MKNGRQIGIETFKNEVYCGSSGDMMEFFKRLFGKVDAKLAEKSKEDCGCQSGCCDDMPAAPVAKAAAAKKPASKKPAKKKATKKR